MPTRRSSCARSSACSCRGGVLNFSVPYYTTTLAIQNLEHKSFWCEDTLKNLFEDDT